MFVESIKNTIMITTFVLSMMLIIEYLNVQTKGKWIHPLQNKGYLQIFLAAILGAIPGCLGTYTAVSLYSHKVFGFAALITVMIATSGDEAFLMLSVIPNKALMLFGVIFIISIISGFIVYLFMQNKSFMKTPENHLTIHDEHIEVIYLKPKNLIKQFRNLSFHRIILIVGLLAFLFGLINGKFVHSHNIFPPHQSELIYQQNTNIEPHNNSTDTDHFNENHSGWNWISTSFLIVSLITLFIILTVNDHFLDDHLWGHIIKKHSLKIFLWTFAALITIQLLNNYFDIENWVAHNLISILLIAVLIGIIPESGPHYIFVFLFAQGAIPFSILLANSIVQDGHGALPLLAESKRSFLLVKLLNLIIGFFIGFLGLYFGL